ncbi:uncharacterized protein MYCFIDRAFT_178084 [Pseudocercospora fijiensis CIRAD86]|uniref:Uncharacterized protein n=1 Tax=Pseudocercospora fijiensis (strain CIRAD86) TaxID=383855 RepID=M3A4E7_PSEFD|nr:uncharacterized protein MYCFIDRAFT_178084 [Pseudocercospora fijiensis CIRAD86]EME79491.1 hypothetical protein MYCFIDRAFT_178084 [Pseudocercospora fijiensis CIRAD86]
MASTSVCSFDGEVETSALLWRTLGTHLWEYAPRLKSPLTRHEVARSAVDALQLGVLAPSGPQPGVHCPKERVLLNADDAFETANASRELLWEMVSYGSSAGTSALVTYRKSGMAVGTRRGNVIRNEILLHTLSPAISFRQLSAPGVLTDVNDSTLGDTAQSNAARLKYLFQTFLPGLVKGYAVGTEYDPEQWSDLIQGLVREFAARIILKCTWVLAVLIARKQAIFGKTCLFAACQAKAESGLKWPMRMDRPRCAHWPYSDPATTETYQESQSSVSTRCE